MQDASDAEKPAALTLDAKGIAQLAAKAQQLAKSQRERVVVAIAGVPGSGKSTLAKALTIHLNRAVEAKLSAEAKPASHYAVVLGMDGFHLPSQEIEAMGLADRKGSVQTFDAQGYLKLLATCRDPDRVAEVPVYDRRVHEPVYTGKPEQRVVRQTRVVVTEGNYLLLDALPWTAIDDLADYKLWLDTPPDRAHHWLVRRHMAGGWSMEKAVAWAKDNDRLNAELILNQSRHADRVVRWPEASFEPR